jgi:hypothetical protein
LRGMLGGGDRGMVRPLLLLLLLLLGLVLG